MEYEVDGKPVNEKIRGVGMASRRYRPFKVIFPILLIVFLSLMMLNFLLLIVGLILDRLGETDVGLGFFIAAGAFQLLEILFILPFLIASGIFRKKYIQSVQIK